MPGLSGPRLGGTRHANQAAHREVSDTPPRAPHKRVGGTAPVGGLSYLDVADHQPGANK